MSSSIIEAKFQALDRTIRQLTKTGYRAKISSSDQLREIVYAERGKPCGYPLPIGKSHTSRPNSRQEKTSPDQRPRSSRDRVSSLVSSVTEDSRVERPSSRQHERESVELQLSEPLGNLTEEILQDAWNEINASVFGDARVCRRRMSEGEWSQSSRAISQTEEPSKEPLRATMSNQEPKERTLPRAETAIPTSNQENHQATVKELSSRRSWATRCGSADGSKSRRNWFEPKAPKPTSQPKAMKVIPQQPSAQHREQVTAGHSIVVAKEDAQDNDESLPSQVDVRSFYYLEVRLEHSAPLSNWRFRVVFTDLSVVSRPSVTVDNVPVNAENCLLFATPNDRGTVVITTYFDSVTHFPHIRKPRELYGHCIRILVHSISPVQRVVIDTLVHFLVEPSTDHPMPPTPETPAPNLDTLQIAVPRPLAAVESDYTGWQSDDDEQQSLRTEQECTTVDRKKTELKQMRARMKHKMQQEQRLLQSPHRR